MTYEPYLPEIYSGKMFMVTPDEGQPFLVSVANDESEIPALVEHHLNPPPSNYPPSGQQQQAFDPIAEIMKRLDAIEAKLRN